MLLLGTLLAVAAGPSAINRTALGILHDPTINAVAHAPPRTFADQTAQIMLAELNETAVATQAGVYPDDLGGFFARYFGVKNATVLAALTRFGKACPRGGMGNRTLTLQQALVYDIALVHTGTMVTCDSIWVTGSLGDAADDGLLPSQRLEVLTEGVNSTGSTALDALLLLTVYGIARQTGLLPPAPPS